MTEQPVAMHQTRSQQRLAYLLSLKRPLDEQEQDDLYRALHADYMRKWRAHRAEREVEELNHARYLVAVGELRG